MIRNLEIATNSPMVTSDIVHHMLALIVDLTEADWEDGESEYDSSSSTDSENETKANECDMDDIILENTPDDISSSEGDNYSVCDKGSTDNKATEMGNVDQSLVIEDSAHHFDKEIVSKNASVSEPSTLNEAEFREQGKDSSADTVRNETKSSSLSWTWNMLRSGCNTAENVLRRIAKIGYVRVQHNAVDGSTHVVADSDEIPARNNKPLETAKAKKNATNPAGNEVEIKEQEVWDRLAIKVRNSGVPVEILQKYESKIASCIIDTVIEELKAEREQDQDLATISDMLLAAETISAVARVSENSEAGAESVSIAENSVHGGHNIPTNENMLMTPIEATRLRSSSSSSSVSGIEVLPEDATCDFQGLCQPTTSCLKQVSSRAIALAAGTCYLTPDSSVVSEGQKEDEGIPSSQGTSLSDNEDKGEGSPVEYVKGGDDRAEAREIGIHEAIEENNDPHRLPACTADSNQETDPFKPVVRNKVYGPCCGEWVEAIKADRYSIFDTATADQEVGNVHFTKGDTIEDENDRGAGDEAGIGEVEDEVEDDASSPIVVALILGPFSTFLETVT